MAARAHSTAHALLRVLESGEIARPFSPIPNLRPWMENRLEQLLDEADRLLALLDALDGDADLEPDAEGEPSLAGFGGFADAGDDRELDESDDEMSLGWTLCTAGLK